MAALNSAVRLDRALELWMFKFARKNYWRVAAFLELEDVIQDGYLLYCKCRNKYLDSVHDKKHFMRLFQTAYYNHITDLANNNRWGDDSSADRRGLGNEKSFSQICADADLRNWMEENCGSYEPDCLLTVLIKEAREPVRSVLFLFTTEPGAIFLRAHPKRDREPPNSYICRLLGLNPKTVDLEALTQSFLSGYGIYHLRRPVQ